MIAQLQHPFDIPVLVHHLLHRPRIKNHRQRQMLRNRRKICRETLEDIIRIRLTLRMRHPALQLHDLRPLQRMRDQGPRQRVHRRSPAHANDVPIMHDPIQIFRRLQSQILLDLLLIIQRRSRHTGLTQPMPLDQLPLQMAHILHRIKNLDFHIALVFRMLQKPRYRRPRNTQLPCDILLTVA